MKRKLVYGLLFTLICIGLILGIHNGSVTAPKSVQLPSLNNEPDEPEQSNETPAFNKSMFSNDDPASIWVVANKKRPLQPLSYAPNDLVSISGQRLRSEAAQQLTALIAAAKQENLTLQPLSGYRSYETQVSVYNNEVRTYGQTVADSQSARPGTSEHQTGLSIDIGGGGCGIEDCFGDTTEGKWVAANAYKYGFIVRYTAGKESITGYRAEPWHIRYIGASLATEMQRTNTTTLEEFFDLPAAPSY